MVTMGLKIYQISWIKDRKQTEEYSNENKKKHKRIMPSLLKAE